MCKSDEVSLLPVRKGEAEPEAEQREDGSWLLAGWMSADEMAEQLGVSLPKRRSYKTVAGLMIGEFQHLPNIGEAIETMGWRFEVIDIDGRRINKVLARRSGDERDQAAAVG